ncbi:MAG TPA: trehalose-phosphatase [Dongiaceae bacterium]
MKPWISPHKPPQPSLDLALFIDFDGTLVDLAPSPDEINVPADLPALLDALRQRLDGAVAIVSGRRIHDLRRFLAPAEPTLVAEHGAVIRMAGAPDTPLTPLWPLSWRRSLEHFERCWPGVEIDEKTYGVAIHFRGAPQAAKAVHDMAHALAEASAGAYHVIAAKMAYELRRPGIDKGTAVRNLMVMPEFNGRVPVFIGDDLTDHDGFAAVTAAQGIALDVATAFDNRPELVRDWLWSFAELTSENR